LLCNDEGSDDDDGSGIDGSAADQGSRKDRGKGGSGKSKFLLIPIN
jgi:hypothetical protein